MIIASFLFFLLLFVAVGVSSSLKSRNTKQDYYMASHSIPPWLVGLSAVATNNSGYMFIGVIGYTYATGLASIWLMLGWIAGDYLVSLFVHDKLRRAAVEGKQASYPGVLNYWAGFSSRTLQKIAALISLVFLLAYASAQLMAGSKALHVLFDWPEWGGAVIGALLVVAYCFAGGIRASIWTDAAQSLVMVLAMGLLLVTATLALGGPAVAFEKMAAVDGFLDWFPRDLVIPGVAGGILFALSWMFAGLSVIGQPHIMVRFMSLEGEGTMRRARAWYYVWFLMFYAMATAVGMLSRIYLPDANSFDQELALPMMALDVFPPLLVGLVLAGIFAATLSTADSLVLSCSSALTHDLFPERCKSTRSLKAATLVVTLAALAWALTSSDSVFNLVIMAWALLASAFAPLVLVLAFGGRPSHALALAMMAVGVLVAVGWRQLGLSGAIYEAMPGILSGLAVYGLARLVMPRALSSSADSV